MPKYVNSPFSPAQLLIKGVSAYLLGSFNYKQANTKMFVTNTALTSNVAIISVQIVEGEIPLVGSLLSIIQTQNGSGSYNVNRAAITNVSINQTTGAGTISFALTHANITTGADTGTAIAEVPEIPETLSNGASAAVCIPAYGDSQITIPVAVTFPTMPTAAVVDLQVALHDNDAEYTLLTNITTVVTSAPTVGPVAEVTLQRGYFYRFNVSGVSGTSTVVGKIGG